jgi:hypothetical protein
MPSWTVIFVVAAVLLAAAGLALVATAGFDDQTRSDLGSALITGVIVGVAIVFLERSIDDRREQREREHREQQLDGMQAVANSALARLITAHMSTLWFALAPYTEPESPAAPLESPAGYLPDDVNRVHQAVQWLREKMGADPLWWRDERFLVTADAVCFTATDLLEQLGFPDHEGDEQDHETETGLQELYLSRNHTIDQLNGFATLFAEAADVERAVALFGQVDALSLPSSMRVYMPALDFISTVDEDDINWLHPRQLSGVRMEICWLVDQLRPGPAVAVNEWGAPFAPDAPDAAAYRWGLLLEPGEDFETMWNSRFAQGSSLRRIFQTAGSELPELFGLDPDQLPSRRLPDHAEPSPAQPEC